METIKTTLNFGKYTFQITDNVLSVKQHIYCRKIMINGNNLDSISVSISYHENLPKSASICNNVHKPEYSTEIHLDRGEGSITMIKTLLQYIHKHLPTITEVSFEDKSNFECVDYNPIPLYYFSIAFNGETWYEKHFNARQKDKNKHEKYREKINELLHSVEFKTNISFIEFLKIAMPPMETIDELEIYYTNSNTFGIFFQSIPKKDRCRLVREWISNFMEHHLSKLFSNTGWIIELPIITKGGKQKSRKYYCPKTRIKHNITYEDFGVDITNI